ncbi:hypothetical protein NAI54_10595, partial [Francisella tularensis subsp. holarctica]|nr:hypothetical protein [Francisella tularensis subsp. holarctica]
CGTIKHIKKPEPKNRIEITNKINNIVHLGLDIRKILSIYMFNDDVTQHERKERLKILIDDLNIGTRVMGTTVDARINII